MQEKCFLYLEAPIQRVCGYDTPFPLVIRSVVITDILSSLLRSQVFEKYYVPDELKVLEAIKQSVAF
jgi:2-oxoisovalerate dehydrogenase E1 component beta subunit